MIATGMTETDTPSTSVHQAPSHRGTTHLREPAHPRNSGPTTSIASGRYLSEGEATSPSFQM